jgi:hypothetical protein
VHRGVLQAGLQAVTAAGHRAPPANPLQSPGFRVRERTAKSRRGTIDDICVAEWG